MTPTVRIYHLGKLQLPVKGCNGHVNMGTIDDSGMTVHIVKSAACRGRRTCGSHMTPEQGPHPGLSFGT